MEFFQAHGWGSYGGSTVKINNVEKSPSFAVNSTYGGNGQIGSMGCSIHSYEIADLKAGDVIYCRWGYAAPSAICRIIGFY